MDYFKKLRSMFGILGQKECKKIDTSHYNEETYVREREKAVQIIQNMLVELDLADVKLDTDISVNKILMNLVNDCEKFKNNEISVRSMVGTLIISRMDMRRELLPEKAKIVNNTIPELTDAAMAEVMLNK